MKVVKHIPYILFILLLAVSIAAAVWWQTNRSPGFLPSELPESRPEGSWPNSVQNEDYLKIEEALPAALELRERIRDDLLGSNQEGWAGIYGWGNGREQRELIMSSVEFFYCYSGCGHTIELAYGDIEEGGTSRVKLRFQFRAHVHRVDGLQKSRQELSRHRTRSQFSLGEELLTIPWGGYAYLVPVDLMPNFCALVNADGLASMRYADYPRKSPVGQADTQWDAELPGLPAVPEEYEDLIPD